MKPIPNMTMNPEPPAANPEESAADTNGVTTQEAQEGLPSKMPSPALIPPISTRSHVPYDEPPCIEAKDTTYEPDYESNFDEVTRERELLMHDIASDNDDFARSNEDGWYYSDED